MTGVLLKSSVLPLCGSLGPSSQPPCFTAGRAREGRSSPGPKLRSFRCSAPSLPLARPGGRAGARARCIRLNKGPAGKRARGLQCVLYTPTVPMSVRASRGTTNVVDIPGWDTWPPMKQGPVGPGQVTVAGGHHLEARGATGEATSGAVSHGGHGHSTAGHGKAAATSAAAAAAVAAAAPAASAAGLSQGPRMHGEQRVPVQAAAQTCSTRVQGCRRAASGIDAVGTVALPSGCNRLKTRLAKAKAMVACCASPSSPCTKRRQVCEVRCAWVIAVLADPCAPAQVGPVWSGLGLGWPLCRVPHI
jgi:hypothetical protein